MARPPAQYPPADPPSRVPSPVLSAAALPVPWWELQVPGVTGASDEDLGWARAVEAAAAAVPPRRRRWWWHAAYGVAAGWAAASSETHGDLPALRDASGESCLLVMVGVPWVAAGAGCSAATAHAARAEVAAALGLGLVPAAGLGLLCDPRTVLLRVPDAVRRGARIACRAAAARGDLPRPLLDQVPLGPPHRLRSRSHLGKHECPRCGAGALVVRRSDEGHRTGWCHACSSGWTVVGLTARRWEGPRRPPSANGRPPPGLAKRPGQHRRRTQYRWDPPRPRNNDPRIRVPPGTPGLPGPAWGDSWVAVARRDWWMPPASPALEGLGVPVGRTGSRAVRRRLVGPDGVCCVVARAFDRRWVLVGPGATPRALAWVASMITETNPRVPSGPGSVPVQATTPRCPRTGTPAGTPAVRASPPPAPTSVT